MRRLATTALTLAIGMRLAASAAAHRLRQHAATLK